MAVMFPKTYYTIRRGKGMYLDGVWVPGVEPAPEPIQMNIQPASESDFARLQALPEGRRVTAGLVAIGSIESNLHVAGADGWPGDIIVYDDKRWLVCGATKFNSLDNDTSHIRYLLMMEVEHGSGEVTA